MSDLTPLLADLSKLIDDIEVQIGKNTHTKDEFNMLLNLINRGLPIIGIEPSSQQWWKLLYGQNNQ
jgi:hypothetical protein